MDLENNVEQTEVIEDVQPPKEEVETKADVMIPKNRFDEVNAKYKEMAEKVAKFEKEQAELERLEQEKKGEFEKLYREKETEITKFQRELEEKEQRVKSLESKFEAMLQNKLSTIDEKYHDLIPTNLTNEEKIEWITKAETKGIFGNKDISIGNPSNPKADIKREPSQMSAMEKLLMGYGKR